MAELPDAVVEEAVRLTSRARAAEEDAEAAVYRERREAMLAEHGFVARVRPEDGSPVLVCHPAEWVIDGDVRLDRIEDVDRAVERPLTGTINEKSWEAVEAHNRAIVEGVADAHGPLHARTAAAFADFLGNHLVLRIENAGTSECREFLEEYFPRNAWPTDEQRSRAAHSLRLAFEAAGAEPPAWLREGEDAG